MASYFKEFSDGTFLCRADLQQTLIYCGVLPAMKVKDLLSNSILK